MRRRRLVQLLRALRKMRVETDRDRLLQRLAGVGSISHRPNDRFGISDYRWKPTGVESLHATPGRREALADGPWEDLSRTTAPANSRQETSLMTTAEISFVGQIWNREVSVFLMNTQFSPKNRRQCRKLG